LKSSPPSSSSNPTNLLIGSFHQTSLLILRGSESRNKLHLRNTLDKPDHTWENFDAELVDEKRHVGDISFDKESICVLLSEAL